MLERAALRLLDTAVFVLISEPMEQFFVIFIASISPALAEPSPISLKDTPSPSVGNLV